MSRDTSRRACRPMRRNDWRSLMPCFLANRFSHSMPRISRWLSVGWAIALVCTVVSSVTRAQAWGVTALVSIATRSVSASSSSSLSDPIRPRQRVIDERSSGSLWRKYCSPQKY